MILTQKRLKSKQRKELAAAFKNIFGLERFFNVQAWERNHYGEKKVSAIENKKELTIKQVVLYAEDYNINLSVGEMSCVIILDIDRKFKPDGILKSKSSYFDDYAPVLNVLHKIGLVSYYIIEADKGGIQIWIPLPKEVNTAAVARALKTYLINEGLTYSKKDLEILTDSPQTWKEEYVYPKLDEAGRIISRNKKAFKKLVVKEAGRCIRLPDPKNSKLIEFGLAYPFTLQQIFVERWKFKAELNTNFSIAACTELTHQKDILYVDNIDRSHNHSTFSPVSPKKSKSTRGGHRENSGRKPGSNADKEFLTLFDSDRSPEEMIQECLEIVSKGWTGPGQTNKILLALNILLSYTYRTYNLSQINKEGLRLIPQIKGFEEHCSADSKNSIFTKDIDKSWNKRIAKSVLKKRDVLFSIEKLRRTHDYDLAQDEQGIFKIKVLSKNGKYVSTISVKGYDGKASNSDWQQKRAEWAEQRRKKREDYKEYEDKLQEEWFVDNKDWLERADKKYIESLEKRKCLFTKDGWVNEKVLSGPVTDTN